MLPDELDLGFTPGDVLVVTGGGSGIGRAVALLAAACGLRVAIWDVDGDAAMGTLEQLAVAGAEAVAMSADAADRDQVAAAMAATVRRWDRAPSFLVCNAGPPARTPFALVDGVANVTACVANPVEAFLAAAPPPGAAIVNVASIAGNFVGSGSDWYAAAKAGMAGLTRALAVRLGPAVRVNAVAPGITRTPRTERLLASGADADLAARCPLGRAGEAEEPAGVILFLCSPLASYVTGVVLPVDGGLLLHQ